jgi:drug/metabolite transporter (DMT)-like permease
MVNYKWVLIILFIAGLIIVVLPDSGKRVIALNKNHGPSIQDLIGLGLLLISWLLSSIIVIRNWKKVKSKIGNRTFRLLLIIYLLAITGIILALAVSSDFFLWICVAVGLLINILYFVYALKR